MRIAIGSNDERISARMLEVLKLHELDCPVGHVVPLEMLPDRAARVGANVIVVVLPPDFAAGLRCVAETHRAMAGAEILAVGPGTDARLILDTLHHGADEYLDENQLETDLNASLGRLKARRHAKTMPGKSGRVISVLAAGGGSGASTVASSVSAVLARRHGECGLIDLRLTSGDLAAMLDLKPAHTMADACDRLERLDQEMFEQLLVRHHSGVHLMAAPRNFQDLDRVTAKGVRRTLSMARLRFPYVVVDLENAFDAEQVEAIWQSDVILLVLRLNYTAVRNARRIIDHFKELGVALECIRPVANSYREPKQLRIGQAEEALGMKILHQIPSDPASVNRAINAGIPVVLQRPGARVSRSIIELADSVNGQISKSEN